MATEYTFLYRGHQITISRETYLAEYVATWSNGRCAGSSPGWGSAHKAERWAKYQVDSRTERQNSAGR